MSWQNALILSGIAFSALCFTVSFWPVKAKRLPAPSPQCKRNSVEAVTK